MTDAQVVRRSNFVASICIWLRPRPHLHPGWRRVPPYQHADLLLIGQQGAHSFLVRGVTQVDGVHFQYSVPDTQAALTRQTVRNYLVGGGVQVMTRILEDAHRESDQSQEFWELYLGYEHAGFVDAKRVAGVITASHDAQA